MKAKFVLLTLGIQLTLFLNSEAQKLVEDFEMPTPITMPDIELIRVDKDDNILLAGSFDFYDGEKINKHLIKLNSDGSLNADFSFEGTQNFLELEFLSTGEIIGLDRDSLYKIDYFGSISKSIYIGVNTFYSDLGIKGDEIFLVADSVGLQKFDINLELDNSFNLDNTFGGGRVNSIAFQGDRILVGGSFNEINGITKNHIARFLPNGILDETFDVGSGIRSSVKEMVVQSDGKVILSNSYYYSVNGVATNGIARLEVDGSIDSEFFPSEKLKGGPNIIKLQNDKLIISTFFKDGDSYYNSLQRLNIDGSLDNSFNPVIGRISELALNSKNEIITFTTDVPLNFLPIQKYSIQGDLVHPFSPPINKIGFFNNASWYNDFIIVTGDFHKLGNTTTYNIGKIDINGNVDSAFVVSREINRSKFLPQEIRIKGNDQIYISTGDKLLKVDEKGLPDPKFKSPDGVNRPYSSGTEEFYIYDFEILNDSQVIAQGLNSVYLLNSDGSYKPFFRSFNNPGINTVAFQSDQKVLIGGSFTEVNNQPVKKIARFDLNGNIDSTFKYIFELDTTIRHSGIIDIIPLPNNEILFVPIFLYNREYQNNINLYKIDTEGIENKDFEYNINQTIKEKSFFEKGFVFKKESFLFTYGISRSRRLTKIDFKGNVDNTFSIDENIIIKNKDPFVPVMIEGNKFLLLGNFEYLNKNTYGLLFVDNDIPVITGTDSTFATFENTSISLTLMDFNVEDADNTFPEDFSLKILEGENYTVEGFDIIPDSNYYGNLTVPIVVNDGEDDSFPYQLEIVVNAVNGIPIITGTDSTFATLEDTPISLLLSDFNVEDVDNSFPEDFTLKILSGENYSVNGFDVIPDSNFYGNLIIPVVVDDGEEESTPYLLEIEVKSVNDIPVIIGTDSTIITQEDSPVSLSLSNFNAEDADHTFPDDFTFKVLEGANYSVDGFEVIPEAGFSGTLSVQIVVNDGEDDSEPYSFTIEVEKVLGLADDFVNEDISIFPNPIENELIIRHGKPISSFRVEIYSIDGKMVFKEAFPKKGDRKLDLHQLKNGVYWLKIKSGKKLKVKKIVKK